MEWTANTLLKWSVDCLTRAGVASARLDSELLLAAAFNGRREDLYLNPDRALEPHIVKVSRSFVERRSQYEPVGYILGRREFWSLEFKVTPDVLLPRPETEILVERFMDLASRYGHKGPLRVLDIGTGSGCIAVTVAKENPESRVTALDISPKALAVAKQNAAVHGVADRLHFVQADLFPEDQEGAYDFILSNPPYIESEVWNTLMPDVKAFEPRAALDGGATGTEFYERIIPGAFDRLREGGALILEIGETQAQAICEMIRQHGGYGSPLVIRDYSGRDRVICTSRRSHG